MEKVSAVRCDTYDLEEVFEAVRESLDRISFELPENKTVLIKPNLMAQNVPDQHTITHYTLVDALCRLLAERHCRILIGDSSAFYQKGVTMKAFETSRLTEVAGKYEARLVPFEKQPLIKIDTGLESVMKELYIPRVLLDADLVINACKLKTHGAMRLSGALKNMFGCLPGGYKQKMHIRTRNEFELSDVILDIHQIVRPDLSVMDAVYSLDGGPTALGRPVKTSRILASGNAAAIDTVACRIVGYEPGEIAFLTGALKRQMISSFDDIDLLGDIEPMKFKHLKREPFPEEKAKDSIFVTDTCVDPVIRRFECRRCGYCTEICPVKAISFKDGRVPVNLDLCIHCYRCLYECPVDAIKAGSSILNKLIRAGRRIIRF